jgi:hypothetical protein
VLRLRARPLQVARTLDDLEQLRVPAVGKIHGCVTRTPTLLVTSAQLAEPPLWTAAAFTAALQGATGVFIGIGDVADYARKRLEKLREDFPELDVYVVSPSIVGGWDESVWATLIPDLDPGRRVQQTADEFLDELARAWAVELSDRVEAATSEFGTPPLVDGVAPTLAALRVECGADVIAWARRAGFRCRAGQSVIRLPAAQVAVTAVGVLAGERGAGEVDFLPDARCRLDASAIQVLVACEMVNATQVENEARRRAEQLTGRGLIDDAAEFVVAGEIIGPLNALPTVDVYEGTIQTDDVLSGPRATRITFTRAADVVARAA